MPREGHFFGLYALTSRIRWGVLLVLTVVLASLAGCQFAPGPAWQTSWAAVAGTGSAAAPAPNARFAFLKVERAGKVAYLVRGYHRLSAADAGTPPIALDAWYSGESELLVLGDGRLQQSLGTPVEWRAVREAARPSWAAVLADGQPHAWQRERDEMPGYRYGVVDAITTQHIDRGIDLPAELGLPAPTALRWVRDEVRTTLPDGADWVYTQWFALAERDGQWQPVWSWQCLAPQWCLDLQPLPQSGS